MIVNNTDIYYGGSDDKIGKDAKQIRDQIRAKCLERYTKEEIIKKMKNDIWYLTVTKMIDE